MLTLSELSAITQAKTLEAEAQALRDKADTLLMPVFRRLMGEIRDTPEGAGVSESVVRAMQALPHGFHRSELRTAINQHERP